MFNKDPDYNHLRTFGCACFPCLPPHTSTKLQPNSVLCVFMGYSVTQKGYKCLNFATNNISVSRHVKFIENMFPFHNKPTLSTPLTQDLPPQLLIPVSKAAEDALVRTNIAPSLSPIQAPSPTTSGSPPSSSSLQFDSDPVPVPIKHPMTTRFQTGSLKPICRLNLLHQVEQSAQQHVPTIYSDASKHVEWRQAMAEEFATL
ncbi:Retrovirus-related Pol polyprotein from transposon TNT 1-94 [Dendrobium catenatum]|uniref:Retrovirus-related Pol polyprotein from transposon TNT 1-94 n=1 Tax=Dendrobium catenatum TaxID=906689 RepID=A0A2I0WVY0_9ASPA|nr:Retrovirus-related Pol polyprotein from transposon TNT 1-94 [Dendrobium catenatum]